MNDHRQNKSAAKGKSRSYSPEQEHQLIAFVLDECGGHFGIEEARDIAARLNKKPASIVAKARSLDLDYRTENRQTPVNVEPEVTEQPTEISMDWLNPEHWSDKLSMLAEEWRLRGQGSLWSVRKGDLLYRLRREADAVTTESLFDPQEIDARRETLQADLESSFLESMTARLHVWPSFFRSRTLGFETLEERFRRKGRHAEFLDALNEYRDRCDQISNRLVDELFDQATISERRFAQMAPARRAAFESEAGQIEAYDQFIETLAQLPEEDIDARLHKLQTEFLYVRRARAWASDFEKLIDEVAGTDTTLPAGGNESPVRLLQHDFLMTMEQRLSLYWRLHQLREKAFAESQTDVIRRLSYLESGLVAMYRGNAKPELCDRTIAEFLDSLEKPASKRTTRTADVKKAALLQIDHSVRLAAWTEFKRRSAESANDITRRFNELKEIVRFTPEWIQEYKIFRAELLVQRSMDASRKNSQQEVADVKAFINQIAMRIELELETDIKYRILEQQVTQAGDPDGKLRVTNQQIVAKIKARAIDDIVKIKRAFLTANGVALPGQPKTQVISMNNWRT